MTGRPENSNWSVEERYEVSRTAISISYMGRAGEGEGLITSTLEESKFETVTEGLKQSIAKVEQDGCTACIDGRCTVCLANKAAPKVRPRKAGGSIAPFAMMGIGDSDYQEALANGTVSTEDLHNAIADLQRHLGRRESGHMSIGTDGQAIFDCGAAGGLVEQTEAVGKLDTDGPVANLVIEALINEGLTRGDAIEVVAGNIKRASRFSKILKDNNWNGQNYVSQVAENDPEAVEVLEYDTEDPLHGHKEQLIALIDGPVNDRGPTHSLDKEEFKLRTGLEAFVVNLDELRRDAVTTSTNRSEAMRFFAAGLLYHLGGVYKKLGDGKHPIFHVAIEAA